MQVQNPDSSKIQTSTCLDIKPWFKIQTSTCSDGSDFEPRLKSEAFWNRTHCHDPKSECVWISDPHCRCYLIDGVPGTVGIQIPALQLTESFELRALSYLISDDLNSGLYIWYSNGRERLHDLCSDHSNTRQKVCYLDAIWITDHLTIGHILTIQLPE